MRVICVGNGKSILKHMLPGQNNFIALIMTLDSRKININDASSEMSFAEVF